MKVILLQDVAKIGRRFETVEVPQGYARNKLIPQGLAKEATTQNVKQVQQRTEKIATEHAAADQAFDDALTALTGKEVIVPAKANENGHLFEAVKPEQIVAAVAAAGVTISPQHVHVGTPIKEIGTHTVALLSGDRRGELTVVVTSV